MNTQDTTTYSLFEYLNRPAGSELGKQVAIAAMLQNIPIDSHEVDTKKYKGRILKYPKYFLDSYFSASFESPSSDDDFLPF